MQNISILEHGIIKNGLSESGYPYNHINNMIKKIGFDSCDNAIIPMKNRLLKVLSCIEIAEKSKLGPSQKENVKLTWGIVAMSIALEIVSKQGK